MPSFPACAKHCSPQPLGGTRHQGIAAATGLWGFPAGETATPSPTEACPGGDGSAVFTRGAAPPGFVAGGHGNEVSDHLAGLRAQPEDRAELRGFDARIAAAQLRAILG